MTPRRPSAARCVSGVDINATHLEPAHLGVYIGIGADARFIAPEQARALANALITAANHYDAETRRIELTRAAAQAGAA